MEEKNFERHDILNGLALTAVLVFFLFLILLAFQSCSASLDDLANAEKREVETTTTLGEADAVAATSVASEPASDPAEVTVRVGNGANRSGLATSGTRLLSQNEYNMLQGRTKTGPTVPESAAYYNEGFAADAQNIAELMSINPDQVLPMPEDPGVPIDTANVVVILGEDAEF